jgi:hypothetical protein
MQPGIRERWLLLAITLLGSGIIIGSEVNRLPPEPQFIQTYQIERLNAVSNEPLVLRPNQDAKQAIAKITPILETF